MTPTLYNQCRSGPSYRVRIALALKNVRYRYVAVDIRAGEQRSPEFLAINPQGLVPAIDTGKRVLTQSGAIIEWLEDRFPQPSLFAEDPEANAVIRGMAAIIGSDMQPLNNLRVQSHLRDRLHSNEAVIKEWIWRWFEEGFEALESLVSTYGDGYCFGNRPTVADVYLVPQVAMSERLGFDISAYPNLAAASKLAGRHPAFRAARPEVQPDWS